MDSFEFLGGRYNRPEQIMSGAVQAFRAQNAATGQTVFIHRVSTTEAPEEQASLLKLLTTALVKSSEAKQMVLDFGEELGYWYVVTKDEPQCALLREWLQLEIEAAAGNGRPASKPISAPTAAPPPPSKQDETDPGEFTRFLKARPSASTAAPATPRFVPPTPTAPSSTPPPPVSLQPPAVSLKPPTVTGPAAMQEASPGEFTQLFRPAARTGQEAAPQPLSAPLPNRPPPNVAPEAPAPGEFTGFFNATDTERKQGRPPMPPPQRPFVPQQPPASPPQDSVPAQQEQGEFTRFFKAGPPAMPSKPAPASPLSMNFERTQNKPFVQRPNTPVNLPAITPQKPADKGGEFTQLFSRPDNAKAPSQPPVGNYGPPPPARSDPLGFAKQPTGPTGQPIGQPPSDISDDLFNDRIDIPKPLPLSQPKQSEFTQMFGSAGAAPPPVRPQSVVAQPREKPLLDASPKPDGSPKEDPMRETQAFSLPKPPALPSTEQQSGGSPSEFTRIMQGGYGPTKQGSGSGAPPAPASGGSGSPLLNVNVSPVNPMNALPHLGGAAGSLGAAHGQANVHGASVGTPLGAANLHGPHIPGANLHVPSANPAIKAPAGAGANKKMIILFSVIGLLAVLLVLLMLFLMKK